MDYEQYTKTCQTIQKTNNRLLQLFEEALVKSGLKEKTINRHLSNVDFFLNEFVQVLCLWKKGFLCWMNISEISLFGNACGLHLPI